MKSTCLFCFLFSAILLSTRAAVQGGCAPFVNNCNAPLIELAEGLISNPSDCKLWDGPCNKESGIWRTGSVNIGAIASLDGYKLGVRGKIITEELKLCKTVWCDYVFADTFKLMPLEDLRKYIAINGHLPECTPASAVLASGGVLIEEETLNQQKKIEEIYLHLIDLRHRLDALGKELAPFQVVAQPAIEDNIADMPEFSGEIAETDFEDALQIECFQVKPAPNGIGGVVIGSGSGPFSLTWTGPSSGSMNNVWCSGGAIQIKNLASGDYILAVSNATGLIGTCSFTISSGNSNVCNVFADPICRQDIVAALKAAFGTPPDCNQWNGSPCSQTVGVYREGKVAIGTDRNQSGYSLAVSGGIVTDKMRIELCETQGWCDYVFDDDYSLMPLAEIETFVRQNRHLPKMISQREITESEGYELKKVILEQQVKIEEAYLHLIELNQNKKVLQQKVNALFEDN